MTSNSKLGRIYKAVGNENIGMVNKNLRELGLI